MAPSNDEFPTSAFRLAQFLYDQDRERPCDSCAGQGKVNTMFGEEHCKKCGGSGITAEPNQVQRVQDTREFDPSRDAPLTTQSAKPKRKPPKPSLKGLDCAWCGGTEGECMGGPVKGLSKCWNCKGSGLEETYDDDPYDLCQECQGKGLTHDWKDCTGEKNCPGGCQGTERDPHEFDPVSKGGQGPMQDCAVCGNKVHESHGNFIDEDDEYGDGEFACDSHWAYGKGKGGIKFVGKVDKTAIGDIGPAEVALGLGAIEVAKILKEHHFGIHADKKLAYCPACLFGRKDDDAKTAQDSSGGGDGGNSPGSGAGGDAYGGGAPDTGAGGASLSEGPHGEGKSKRKFKRVIEVHAGEVVPMDDIDQPIGPATKPKKLKDRIMKGLDDLTDKVVWAYDPPEDIDVPLEKKSWRAVHAADALPGTGNEWAGNPFGKPEYKDPESEEDWGACQYDDGNTAVTDFLGKKVCEKHLQYALDDAPSALSKAEQGVNTTSGSDRLNFENAVQKIRKDMERGKKTLQEVELKKSLQQSGISLARAEDLDLNEDEDTEDYYGFSGSGACDYGHYSPEVRRLPTGDRSAVNVCRDHYAQEAEYRNMRQQDNPNADWSIEPWDELEYSEDPEETRKPIKRNSSTQEKKAMYECDKCGVQATHESVTRTGARGLLCDDHAVTMKLASDAVDAGINILPLVKDHAPARDEVVAEKKAQSIPEDLDDDAELERARLAEHEDGNHQLCYGLPCEAPDRKASKQELPEWLQEFAPKTEEKTAAIACRDCDGSGLCSCGGSGRNCADCESTGLCPTCHGEGLDPGPTEKRYDFAVQSGAYLECPGCGLNKARTAAATKDPEDNPEEHVHTDVDMEGIEDPESDLPPSEEVADEEVKGKWADLEERHPWAKVQQCPGCGQGHVVCTHPFHGDSPPAYDLPPSTEANWDAELAKFVESDESAFSSGGVSKQPEADMTPKTMDDLPKTKKKIRDMEAQGLVYHQTVREPGADPTDVHRHVHETREEALSAHQRALDAGFESELQPVMRMKGRPTDIDEFAHELHGRPTPGMSDMAPSKPNAPKKTSSVCPGGSCPVSVFEEEHQLILAYIQENELDDLEKTAKEGFGINPVDACDVCRGTGSRNGAACAECRGRGSKNPGAQNGTGTPVMAQNIGCPNCQGMGSTPDGKICPACFGTGKGGGMMLKGGSDDFDSTKWECNERGCFEPGDEVYDNYGIYAGRYCDKHRHNAPGQWDYAGADTEPLDEDYPNPQRWGKVLVAKPKAQSTGEPMEVTKVVHKDKVASEEEASKRVVDQLTTSGWHDLAVKATGKNEVGHYVVNLVGHPGKAKPAFAAKVFCPGGPLCDHASGLCEKVETGRVNSFNDVTEDPSASNDPDVERRVQEALQDRADDAEYERYASLEAPEEGAIGYLYGDDGQTFRSVDGGETWDKVSGKERGTGRCADCGKTPENHNDDDDHAYSEATTERSAAQQEGVPGALGDAADDDRASKCAFCDKKPMWKADWVSHGGQSRTSHFFCDDHYDSAHNFTGGWTEIQHLGAVEHDQEEKDEDDDIKLFKFDHGPGQGKDVAHSEIHQQEHIASTDDEMTGRGCGKCGSDSHQSESCPQSKEAAVDELIMEDPYELSDDELMLDPFESATKHHNPEEDKKTKVKKKVKKVEDVVDKVTDAVNWALGPPKKHHGASNNPGAGPVGTSIDDLVDNVGTGEHAVPVTLITDHKGEVAQGVEPASCRTCGEPMADHAQWNPTHQNGNPKQAAFETLGWMDVLPEDKRPRRGDHLVKEAHVPTYDLQPHDLQAAPVGTVCSACGRGGDARLGAVGAFPDPADPIEGKLYMHQPHFEEYKASVKNPVSTQSVGTGTPGSGVTINIFANKEE